MIKMNETTLVSVEELRKEKFNELILNVNSASEFLAYYALLLKNAVEYELLLEEEERKILYLMNSQLNDYFCSNSKVMSNNLYVLTVYLKCHNNIWQLERIRKLRNQEEVDLLFKEVYDWVCFQSKELKNKLANLKSAVSEINDVSVSKEYMYLLRYSDMIANYSSTDSEIVFKKLHKSVNCDYNFYSERIATDFIDKIKKCVQQFEIEVLLIKKINIGSLVENLKLNISNGMMEKQEAFEIKVNKVNQELSALKENYYRELELYRKKVEEISEMNDKIAEEQTEEFILEHPELKGQELEEAVEEHLDIVAEMMYYELDYSEDDLEMKYEKKKERLENQLEKLENEGFENERADMSFNFTFNLENVIKIKYILYKAETDVEFSLPQNARKMIVLIDNTDFELAVNYLLNNFNLSNIEIEYLKR